MDAQAMFKEDLECELWANRAREPDLAQVAPRPLLAPIAAQLHRRPGARGTRAPADRGFSQAPGGLSPRQAVA